jgi:hypothetical protein
MLPLLIALVGVTACFHYEPLGDRPPAAGAMVRVHLTDPGALELAPVLGPGAREVDGVLVGVPDTAFVVSVSAVAREGARITWAGETVSLPRHAVAFMERRTIDRTRSAIAAGGTLAAVLLTARLARNAGGSAPGTDGGGPPAP